MVFLLFQQIVLGRVRHDRSKVGNLSQPLEPRPRHVSHYLLHIVHWHCSIERQGPKREQKLLSRAVSR